MFELIKPDTRFDIVGTQGKALWFSGLLVLASLLALVLVGPTFGIDFKGGSDIILHFDGDADVDQVREAAEEVLPDVQVQRYGADEEHRFLLQTRAVSVVDQPKATEIEENLTGLGDLQEWEWNPEQPNRAEATFASPVEVSQIQNALQDAGLEHTEVEADTFGEINRYIIGFEGLQRFVVDSFTEQFPEQFDPGSGLERMETVGAQVGEQFRNAGILSVLVATLLMLIYIAFRFDIRYAPGAVAAIVHDVVLAVGFFTVFQIEISLPIIAALLTIVGYSINDTIVIFDRIRENLESATTEPIEKVTNRSINETLSRTFMTSITTLLAVTAIAVFAGGLIQDFAVALIFGVLVGTYSSVFVATPVMLRMDTYLKNRREAEELLETQKAKKSMVS